MSSTLSKNTASTEIGLAPQEKKNLKPSNCSPALAFHLRGEQFRFCLPVFAQAKYLAPGEKLLLDTSSTSKGMNSVLSRNATTTTLKCGFSGQSANSTGSESTQECIGSPRTSPSSAEKTSESTSADDAIAKAALLPLTDAESSPEIETDKSESVPSSS
jgi:hypothetical protein